MCVSTLQSVHGSIWLGCDGVKMLDYGDTTVFDVYMSPVKAKINIKVLS